MIIKCQECGKEFEKKMTRQIFCQRSCTKQYHNRKSNDKRFFENKITYKEMDTIEEKKMEKQKEMEKIDIEFDKEVIIIDSYLQVKYSKLDINSKRRIVKILIKLTRNYINNIANDESDAFEMMGRVLHDLIIGK
jgi:hypothetical protein